MNWDLSLNRHVTIRHHYEHSQSSGVKRLSVHFWKNHMYVHLGADGVCDRRTEIKTNEAVTKKNDKRSFSSFLKHDLSAFEKEQEMPQAPKWTHIVPLPVGMKRKGRIEKKKKKSFLMEKMSRGRIPGWERKGKTKHKDERVGVKIREWYIGNQATVKM